MRIGEVCTRTVAIVRKTESINDAALVMRELGVGDVVVVESKNGVNEPVGMLTDRDIVLRGICERRDLDAATAFDFMTLAPVVAFEDESVFAVIEQMREHGVRRVPIVSQTGALVGIAAYDDLVELLTHALAGLVKIVERGRQREERALR